MQCFSCDYEGTRRGLGSHYGSKPDHRPRLSSKQHEIITGLLMGDGHINRSATTPRLRAEMANKEYLEYLDEQFPHIGCGVTLSRTAKEQSLNHRQSGFNVEADSDTYSDCYWWETMAHQELSDYAEWYESGEKVFPEDLNITPVTLKHWYVCDGYLRPEGTICIYLDNERDNDSKIDAYFADIIEDGTSWDVRERGGNSYTRVRFSSADSEKLFSYMGEPLPGFREKWPTERFK